MSLLVELRRVLDLVLRQVDEDRLRVGIELANEPCRKHHFLAEDPRTRIDHNEAPTRLVGRLVDLADAAVACLDAEARQIYVRWCRNRESPHLDGRHDH